MSTTIPSLAATMKHLNLTQAATGLLLGASVGSINRWLANERTVPEHLRRLLVVLDNGRNTSALEAIDRYAPFEVAARQPRVRQLTTEKALSAVERQRRYRERKKQARAM
jgi:hypothetical protein